MPWRALLVAQLLSALLVAQLLPTPLVAQLLPTLLVAQMEDRLEKLQYDLYYIKHRGVFLDINILIKTIGTVLFYRGQ